MGLLNASSTPRITARGLAAVAAARRGATLYIYRGSKWVRTGPRELRRAERLALHNPQALVMYGSGP